MNKKLIFWIIIIIILLIVGYFVYVSLTGGANAGTGLASLKASCTDSDGGQNYEVKGVVSKGANSNTDICSAVTVLKEYFCSGNSIKSISYTCPSDYKCSNGACVPSCVPATCSSLGKECGTWSDKCNGNLDCGTCSGGNSCTVNGQCLQSTDTCFDSDNGLSYSVRGSVNGTLSGSPYGYTDSCEASGILKEYFCQGTISQYTYMLCNSTNNFTICSNGACVY